MKLRAAAAILLAACTVPTATLVDPDAPDQPDAPHADAGADAPADGAPDAMLAVAMLSGQPSTDAAFGDVVLGQTSGAQGYTISNDGDLASGSIALAVDDTTAGFAIANDTCSGVALAGHHICTFGVTFAPAAPGAQATTLRVIATPGGEVDRDLGGNGLEPGAIDLVEHGWDFGDRGVDAGAFKHAFDLTNGGQVAIGAPQIAIGGATDAYFLDATTCTQTLAPGAHCTVTVRFDPATVGDKAGSLTVTSAPGGSDAATLSGTGVAHVTVTRAGTGTGSVASNQPGIDCGTTCDADFSSTPVTLQATAAVGTTFTGWTGDCAGAGSCTLDLTGAKHVTATFAAITPTLTATRIGNGSGTITSSPNGIACGATCAAPFAYDATVTLTATPTAGSTFAGWTGACAGTGPCAVTMDQARGVTAEFDAVTPPLVVTIAGTGAGTVTSKPDGVSCAPTCSATYAFGTIVTLTAATTPGNSFTGWSGGSCSGTNPTCIVTIDQERDVTATFDAITPTLTVARGGTQGGNVASTPAGIDCGATCSAQFAFATTVTLTATAQTGQQFTAWSGACTGTAPTCVVSMDQARTVTATFAAFTPTLAVTRSGTGTGTVASTGAGISCGSTCSHAYNFGDTVVLTATAGTGATFTGWSGACAGTAATCTVTMDQAQNVIATFDALTPEVDVSLTGTGLGSVSSAPAGITCGSACSASFTFGTSVTLTASATTGSTFAGWGGACAGVTTSTCVVVADRARAVTAQFDAVTPPLTVALAGKGSGKVTSNPAAIDCGTSCTATFAYGQSVTLTPVASAGSTFASWSGACTGSGACVVSMTTARNVTATFTLDVLNLTTATGGNGMGSLALSPSGTSCGAGCASFDYGTTVVITATAAAGSTFTGWSGDCTTTAASCTVTIDQARSATATFTLKTFPITVATVGAGTVTPNPSGTACGAGCSSYNYGTAVTLTAAASTGSTFAGWSGAGSGACNGTSAPTCTVTADQARAITATFTINIYDLVVTTAGTGTVSLAPGGSACGTGCTAYPYGSSVTLSASAGTGSTFAGWSGSGAGLCAGQTTSCILTIDQQRAVTATFTLNNEPLTLTASGNGSISQSVGGTACGTGCSSYAYGTSLTLTANPNLGSTFTGWSGDAGTCTGTTTATCTIVMDRPRAITATFTPIAEKLTSSATGTGTGTIAANPSGTGCGAGCATFDYGTSVVLTATPAAGSTFAGWSGACTNATGTCMVTMTQAQSVSARFDAVQVQLTLSNPGNGPGTITPSPAGTSCGAGCYAYNQGASVTITAAAGTGATFTGWGGACSGTTTTCTVTLSSSKSATARFDLILEVLNWQTAGNGSGTIGTNPAGQSGACFSDCPAYNYGTVVTLTAFPSMGSSFTGWSGACTNTTGTCMVTMNQAQSVTATFALATETLTWSTSGTGAGTIATNPAGASCGAGCLSFNYGTAVAVTASPQTGSSFTSWGGACSGSGACTITMNANKAVTVAFALNSYTLTVTAPIGGTISSSPAGIACGTACSASFTYGAAVSLTATPATGYAFTSWGGACSGTSTTCPLTISGSTSVSASFTAITPTLTVTKNGSGGGTVVDSAGKINCGGTCASTYSFGQGLTLTATAATGSTFSGWSGACTGTGTCTVTMDQARNVTATFTINTYPVNVAFPGDAGGSVGYGVIFCSAAPCNYTATYGTSFTLTESPSGGALFAGWSGPCSGTAPSCTFTVTGPVNVGAEFDRSSYTLTTNAPITKLVSTPAGIDCGSLTGHSACSATFARGTVVSLKLTPKAPIGCQIDTITWTGTTNDDACLGASICSTTMLADSNVTVGYGVDCTQ